MRGRETWASASVVKSEQKDHQRCRSFQTRNRLCKQENKCWSRFVLILQRWCSSSSWCKSSYTCGGRMMIKRGWRLRWWESREATWATMESREKLGSLGTHESFRGAKREGDGGEGNYLKWTDCNMRLTHRLNHANIKVERSDSRIPGSLFSLSRSFYSCLGRKEERERKRVLLLKRGSDQMRWGLILSFPVRFLSSIIHLLTLWCKRRRGNLTGRGLYSLFFVSAGCPIRKKRKSSKKSQRLMHEEMKISRHSCFSSHHSVIHSFYFCFFCSIEVRHSFLSCLMFDDRHEQLIRGSQQKKVKRKDQRLILFSFFFNRIIIIRYSVFFILESHVLISSLFSFKIKCQACLTLFRAQNNMSTSLKLIV